jgi:hypothetical protein
VAATSTANAWAVGTFAVGSNTRTLTERWNGTRWQHVTSPNPGGTAGPISNELNAVAATSSSNAWAVGEYTATGEGPQPIVEHWNGHKWSSVTSWRPKGQSAVFLTGVTATSATNAWAVGYYETGDTDMTLVEHWNGKTWAKVASPNPSGSRGSNLDGVSASSAKNAWAVGFYLTPHGAAPLIEHWNGKTWQRVPSPNPGGTGELRGVVSIYSARAVAVGYSGATGVALVLRWNGRTWNQVSSPSPGTNSILDGVSGTSATNAGAVGYYVSSAGSNNLAVHV